MKHGLVGHVGALLFIVSCGGSVTQSGDPTGGAGGGNVSTAGNGGASTGAGGANSGASSASSSSTATGVSGPSTGAGGASSASTGVGGATAGRGGQGGSIADAGPGACVPNAGRSAARTFTNEQYDNTIRDLLAYQGSPSKEFTWPDTLTWDGFEVERAEPISMLRLSHYLQAAERVAADTVTNRLAAVLGCDPQAMGEDACATSFIARFGLMAYRAPLAPADSMALQKVYGDARANGSFASAIQSVITSVLLSPQFYLLERADAPNTLSRLSPYQVATRLSYFVTQSTPDRQLLDAAVAGVLATPDGVQKETLRLLATPRAHDAVKAFFRQWLRLYRLDQPNSNYPAFGATFQHMKTEAELFGEAVFFGRGGVRDLLTSRQTFVNEPLAQIYGLPGFVGAEFRAATLDASQRSGLLTMLAPLTVDSRTDGSPVYRGMFVRGKLLCQPLPPPPANVPPLPPPDNLPPDATNRQRYQQHVSNPICSTCHQLVDPIGFGFENFDGIGRYRTTDHGHPVDASGMIASADADVQGPFNGPIELASKLAGSQQVAACLALQWFRFGLSRSESDEDRCSTEAAASVLRKGGSFADVVVAVTMSDSFRYARW